MSRCIGLVCLAVIVVATSGKESKVKIIMPPENIVKMSENMLFCVDESGVAPDIMFQIREKKQTDDENLQKFIYCMFRKLNIGDKKGHLKVDKLTDFLKVMGNEEVKKIIEECNTKQGKNALETSTNVFLCNQDKLEIVYGF